MPTSQLTLLPPKTLQISATKLTGLFALACVAALGTGAVGCAGNDGVTPASGGATGTAGLSAGGAAGSLGSAGTATLGGSAGQASAGTSTAGAGGGGIEPSFAMLKGVIKMSCFGGVCHDLPEHPLHLTIDDNLYTTLTTHMTKHCGVVVKPGAPQESALVKLLKGPCGETNRMPLDKCTVDTDEACVRPEQIAAIEQWIAKGAPP